jgi:crossover junction endodeoxyribonuclease RuvC
MRFGGDWQGDDFPMKDMTDILALDIATRSGWARGIVGATPIAGSVCFAKHDDSSDNAIFANALAWISELLKPEPRPQRLVIEAMLSPLAMKGETSRAVRDRLAGLHGIVRAVAYLRGIYDIRTVAVADVRWHFIGANPRRARAKHDTLEVCRRLGWLAEDDNAADALALWSHACACLAPVTALKVSPLFHRRPSP